MRNTILSIGAIHRGLAMETSDEWRPMGSAPRDGTVIEIRCSYGVAPWYKLYRWGTTYSAHSNDGIVEFEGEPHWCAVPSDGSSFTEDATFNWRPYNGDPQNYSDPTGGFQNDPAYWRGAVAAKYGLPLDYFEAEAARNARRNQCQPELEPLPWWKWLFG